MEALLWLLVVVLFVWVARLSARRTADVADFERLQEQLVTLTRRIFALETALGAEPGVAAPCAPEEPAPASTEQPAPPALPLEPEAPEVAVPELPSLPPQPARELPAKGEWEAVVGGSWLNKAGVVVLVIGIALFIGYSLRQLGPGGRVGVALAASVAMLLGGAALERRPRYKVAARGLLGGGWAALFVTTYAAHGVEDAKVIENAAVATVLLSLVAIGMILHSLRYRSQVVTGLAYFAAFMALAITPLTAFAVVALLPLAASLLFLAHRFGWTAMAILGLPATYGLYFLHAARSAGGSLAAGQSVLCVYWLLFEGFDILESLRGRGQNPRIPVYFPLNTFGFVAVSLAQWLAVSPDNVHNLLEIAAALYLASALVRAKILPPSSFPEARPVAERLARGGYEGAATVAAAFAAVAIPLHFTGMSVNLAWLLEAELLFLAGLQFEQAYLSGLGGLVFVLSLTKLLGVDVPADEEVVIAGRQFKAWSPVALAHAVVFFLNRLGLPSARYYSHAAAGLIAVILAAELPNEWIGLAWLCLGLVLHELGSSRSLRDFVVAGYWVGALSLAALLVFNILTASHGPWLPQLLSVLLWYAAAARFTARNAPALARNLACLAGSTVATALLWNVLPPALVALVWALFGLCHLLAGIRWDIRGLRIVSHALAVLAFLRVWAADLAGEYQIAGMPARILTVAVVAALFYAAELFSPRPMPGARSASALVWIDSNARTLFSSLATVLVAALLYYEVSGRLLTVAWGLQGLALLALGFPIRERNMRLAGLALLLLCILKLFFYDLRNLDTPFRILSFCALGVILIAVSLAYSRFRDRITRYL